jgi:hypothetical protein
VPIVAGLRAALFDANAVLQFSPHSGNLLSLGCARIVNPEKAV